MFSVKLVSKKGFYLKFEKGFLFVLIVMGAAAILLKFFDGEKSYFFLGLYARIVLVACFMSLVLFFSINELYIHISKQAGNKIATEIVAFEQEHDRYPETLDEIEDDLHFNFLESLFYRRINYQSLEKGFELTSTSLLYQEKLIYDVEFMCWM